MLSEGSGDQNDQTAGFVVSGVKEVALEGFLMIDWASLQALQVLHQDSEGPPAPDEGQMQKAY